MCIRDRLYGSRALIVHSSDLRDYSINPAGGWWNAWQWDISVSYTHLDVYKRQRETLVGDLATGSVASRRHVPVEPLERLLQDVDLIGDLLWAVPFVGVDDQFGGNAQRFHRVPKLEGLRRGHFFVALTL